MIWFIRIMDLFYYLIYGIINWISKYLYFNFFMFWIQYCNFCIGVNYITN